MTQKALFNKITKNRQKRTAVDVTQISSGANTTETRKALTKFITETSTNSNKVLYLIDFSIEARRAIICGGATSFEEIYNKPVVSGAYMEILADAIVQRLQPVIQSLASVKNSIIHLVLDGNSPESKRATSFQRSRKSQRALYSNINILLSRKLFDNK